MVTILFMSVMQNLCATCWFSLNMNICILQYKRMFSMYTYIYNNNSHYFSLSRQWLWMIIHMDDSVSVSLQYLYQTITFY